MKILKYCPELNTFTGSITASLLLCQLEYWFTKKDFKPFYKFLEPCDDEHYKQGDSWTEEMGFTKAEFRTAFRHIGKVYKSKSEFLKSKDKFAGKLYLSYYDRIKKLTYYIRNDEKVNALLANLDCTSPYSVDYPSSKINPIVSNILTTSVPPPLHLPYAQILMLFHKCCPSLKPITHLSHACKKQLELLYHDLQSKGEDVLTCLEKAFNLVESSDFLCGRGAKSRFKAAFSWIIRPDKFFAILDGAYAPFSQVQATSNVTPVSKSTPPSGYIPVAESASDFNSIPATKSVLPSKSSPVAASIPDFQHNSTTKSVVFPKSLPTTGSTTPPKPTSATGSIMPPNLAPAAGSAMPPKFTSGTESIMPPKSTSGTGSIMSPKSTPAARSTMPPNLAPAARTVSTSKYTPAAKPTPTFMRMYTHNFDIKALEAREQAYLEALYGQV